MRRPSVPPTRGPSVPPARRPSSLSPLSDGVEPPVGVLRDHRRAPRVIGPEDGVVHPLPLGQDEVVVAAVLVERERLGMFPARRRQSGIRLSRIWKTGIERPRIESAREI